jgi:hypothetical protein
MVTLPDDPGILTNAHFGQRLPPETLEGVDYPLFGDTSFFDIIIFYQKIFKELLKK